MGKTDKKIRPTYVVDIEADGLLDDVTKVHVVSYSHVSDLSPKSITNPDEIRAFFSQDGLTVIGHNFRMYDAEVLRKVLGIEITYKIVDTLGVSWYLESSSSRTKHGLEVYGDELGVPKPKIDDWSEDNIDAIILRCEADVSINWKLWVEVQQPYLMELYDRDVSEIRRLIEYIGFKLDCFAEQQFTGVSLDVHSLLSSLKELKDLAKEKKEALEKAMPKIPIKTIKRAPKRMYNKEGDLTKLGEEWVELLHERGLPESYEGEVEIIRGWENGNPSSSSQVKEWLYSLGWKPSHIKYVRDKKTNEVRGIPQVVSEFERPELCESVKLLSKQDPAVENLSGLATIEHRIGVLEGFIRDFKQGGRIYQDIGGFTNTMRVKHRVIVNLPKPKAPFASGIRHCLVAGEGKLLCGTDLSGIEDATKQHYIYPYDPEYVDEMQSEDWDPHINIAIVSGLMSQEEGDLYKSLDAKRERGEELSHEEKKEYDRLKEIRSQSKTVNFSSTYKVGKKTLSRSLKSTEAFAERLLKGFWERNKAILQVEAAAEKKTVNGQLWVKQPVSGFWYSLRAEKDTFSTLNQGTAVYCFDRWLYYIREQGVKVAFQVHDETTFEVDEGDAELNREIPRRAIDRVNEELKLNVVIGCSVDIGKRYTDVH